MEIHLSEDFSSNYNRAQLTNLITALRPEMVRSDYVWRESLKGVDLQKNNKKKEKIEMEYTWQDFADNIVYITKWIMGWNTELVHTFEKQSTDQMVAGTKTKYMLAIFVIRA